MIRALIGSRAFSETKTIKVTVWNENVYETKSEQVVRKIYPRGIHETIAEGLRPYGFQIRTAVFQQPEQGLSEALLNDTDVLIYWSHLAQEQISDEIVDRLQRRVLEGMGLIVLHAAHYSKIFRRLMGTSCKQKWRDVPGEKQRLWVVNPAHPIAEGLGSYFELEPEEMYGEFFDIPQPDSLVLISWFKGGEVFRSGCTFYRGLGKIFFFQPGHETFPTYHNPMIIKVIANAVRWAASPHGAEPTYGNSKPLEDIGMNL